MISLDTLENYDCIFEELYSNNSNNNYNCIVKQNELEQTILLQTPRFQLQSNIQSGYIVLGCNTILKKNENFINLIKRLEVEFGEYIKKKLKKRKYKLYSGFIDSTREVKYIFKLYNGKDVILFDENKNRVDSVNVKLYSDIILIIKLRNLWINNEKKLYGINWDIEQGRVFPEIDYNKCLIYDSDEETNTNVKSRSIVIQKCLFCNSQCTYNDTPGNIMLGRGKGKGKGINTNTGTAKGKGGRGSIVNVIKEVKKPVEKKKDTMVILAPTQDELIKVRDRLKKMVKTPDSDSD
tara:strand:+ start:67 stop:948 length:882 start_codon:yes stop_codon:yes gene_type:complete